MHVAVSQNFSLESKNLSQICIRQWNRAVISENSETLNFSQQIFLIGTELPLDSLLQKNYLPNIDIFCKIWGKKAKTNFLQRKVGCYQNFTSNQSKNSKLNFKKLLEKLPSYAFALFTVLPEYIFWKLISSKFCYPIKNPV